MGWWEQGGRDGRGKGSRLSSYKGFSSTLKANNRPQSTPQMPFI